MFFYSEHGAETAHQQLWIPYAGIAAGVLLLAVVFLFTRLPEIQPPDEYHLSDASGGMCSRNNHCLEISA
jgi:fucose permease